MYVKTIVRDFLIKNEYDGLFNEDGECACEVEDLSPCGEMSENCTAGYSGPCTCGNGCDFDIYPTKKEVKVAEANNADD